jgi:RNA polymerase sigma-70 factor (ECF subfamily)
MDIDNHLTELHCQDEHELWEEIRRGSQTALKVVFTKYYKVLYNYGVKMADIAVVEDCIQEVFVSIINSGPKLGSINSMKFYLLLSLRRKIVETLKKNKRLSLFSQNADYDFELSYEEQVIQLQTKDELRHRLDEAIRKLPNRQKEAIFLRFYGSLSYAEVAQIMNLDYQSVRNLIFKAITAFRKDISR